MPVSTEISPHAGLRFLKWTAIAAVPLAIAVTLSPPEKPPSRREEVPVIETSDRLTEAAKEWFVTVAGHHVSCHDGSDYRGYILFPNEAELAAGAGPVANYTPTPEAWRNICGAGAY